MSKARAYSLDALRGYAIVTMVLSATVAGGILPGWMYHAQLPPPSNLFDPQIPGITWVDLVFPFFLFAMGAAFPFSLGAKLDKGVSPFRLVYDSLLRGLKLCFFAIFIQHMYPYVISSPQDMRAWLITLTAFVLLFPMFMRMPWKMKRRWEILIEFSAYALATVMMLCVHYAGDRTFSLYFSNIIILILANMAVFGSIVYIFTYKNRWARVGVLPFLMAVYLSGNIEGSWTAVLLNYSPVPWFFQFGFLRYLFILLPASVAGEYLKQWLSSGRDTIIGANRYSFRILVICLALIVCNLYCLYVRNLFTNVWISAILILSLYYLTAGKDRNSGYWRKLTTIGGYLLFLGLFFEAYEGGIHKDPATYSYYFVTTGLGCITLIVFSVICDVYRWKVVCRPFELAGENPMIAYVACSMLIEPLLSICGVYSVFMNMNGNVLEGVLRGVILTTLALLTAIFFSKIKWYWRT